MKHGTKVYHITVFVLATISLIITLCVSIDTFVPMLFLWVFAVCVMQLGTNLSFKNLVKELYVDYMTGATYIEHDIKLLLNKAKHTLASYAKLFMFPYSTDDASKRTLLLAVPEDICLPVYVSGVDTLILDLKVSESGYTVDTIRALHKNFDLRVSILGATYFDTYLMQFNSKTFPYQCIMPYLIDTDEDKLNFYDMQAERLDCMWGAV